MRHVIGLGAVLLLLAGCTPGDERYCKAYGVEGTAEYGNCLNYYHQQEAIFGADRAVCEQQADYTYPPTLYDNGQTTSIARYNSHGKYVGNQIVSVSPDYQHNAQVDMLRGRIIEPCMQAKGWNSGNSWQAGRHPVTVVRPSPMPQQPMPQQPRPMQPTTNQLPWMH